MSTCAIAQFPVKRAWVLCLLLFLTCLPSRAGAEAGERKFEIQLGDEYTEYKRERGQPPTRRGSSGRAGSSSSGITAGDVLLYLPNRFVDLFDILRFDIGFGASTGAIIRASKYVQAGYRQFNPTSVRIGLRGRKAPYFLERQSEKGLSPYFYPSRDRQVTPVEFGVGVDLFFAGVYVGISFDETADFLGGIFGFDFKHDDF